MTASGRFTELIASGKAMSACRTPINTAQPFITVNARSAHIFIGSYQ